MRMESTALQFSPQIAALAMPQESGFTKAAEGIGNVGKVFNEADDRASAQALNSLRMEEANQSIIGKKNENSLFDVTARGKKLENMKRQLDYDAEVKKADESGITAKISGMLPTSAYLRDGKIDQKTFDATREAFLSDPAWEGKGHIVNAVFDTKLKDMQGIIEGDLKNKKVNAETGNLTEETKFIAPKARAYIYQSTSAGNASNASANKNNVEAYLAPKKLTLDQEREDRLRGKESTVENTDTPKVWADNVKMGRMEHIIPGYSNLDTRTQNYVNGRYKKTGQIPIVAPVEPGDNFGSATHKVQWQTKPSITQPPEQTGQDVQYKVGEIKTNNSTGQKAQWDGHGWVLVQ